MRYIFRGAVFVLVDELRLGRCDGCAMVQLNDCLAFHEAHPGFSCVKYYSIVVPFKGESNATSQED